DVDLDSQFALPRSDYDIVLLLGILYHLKNPFYVLEKLAYASEFCLLSTRIAKFTPNGYVMLRDLPVAYLLDADEANHDPTNYWSLSEAGLRRLLSRTGWDVRAWVTLGDTVRSNPSSNDHDERAFCLIRSHRFNR